VEGGPPIKLAAYNLGLITWKDGWEAQKAAHAKVLSGEFEGIFLCLEHMPTLTLGKNSDLSWLKSTLADLTDSGVQLEQADRGGEITAHEPGQIVIYPILALTRLKLTPRSYVHYLEEAVIQTLAEFGIRAHRDPSYPGVWVEKEKICALGVRISERISMHGLALNVSNTLNLFRVIVPCGIKGRGVTSLCLQLGQDVSVMVVTEKLVANLGRLIFGKTVFMETEVVDGLLARGKS